MEPEFCITAGVVVAVEVASDVRVGFAKEAGIEVVVVVFGERSTSISISTSVTGGNFAAAELTVNVGVGAVKIGAVDEGVTTELVDETRGSCCLETSGWIDDSTGVLMASS